MSIVEPVWAALIAAPADFACVLSAGVPNCSVNIEEVKTVLKYLVFLIFSIFFIRKIVEKIGIF